VLYIGTSGWQYASWRGSFYPVGLPQRQWLASYAERFPTVEINNAFYRLPERDTFAAWRAQVPEDEQVAVKVSRYLTHVRRLRDPAEPVARFWSRAEALGDSLGPVLLQLPPTLRADRDALDAVLAQFPSTARVVVEPRHDSWWSEQVADVLRAHGAALCWADRRSRPVTPLWRTAGFGYVRLHEGTAQPWPRYGRAALDSWLHRISSTFNTRTDDVFVFFNNDQEAAAVADAAALIERARALGLHLARDQLVRAGRSPTPDQADDDSRHHSAAGHAEHHRAGGAEQLERAGQQHDHQTSPDNPGRCPRRESAAEQNPRD
jgi:uncharacterized protein YecE (DUF72 family)